MLARQAGTSSGVASQECVAFSIGSYGIHCVMHHYSLLIDDLMGTNLEDMRYATLSLTPRFPITCKFSGFSDAMGTFCLNQYRCNKTKFF